MLGRLFTIVVVSMSSVSQGSAQTSDMSGDRPDAPSVEDKRMATLGEAEVLYDKAWVATPFVVRKVLFVEGPARGFGAYVPRTDAAFAPGETLYVYAEPVGFGYEAQGRLKRVRLAFDLILLDAAGETVLYQQRDFGGFDFQSHAKNREVNLGLTATFDGLAAGAYTVGVRVRDLVSGETDEVRLPFQIRQA